MPSSPPASFSFLAQKALLKKYVKAIDVLWEKEPVTFTKKELRHMNEQRLDSNNARMITLIFQVKLDTINYAPDGSTSKVTTSSCWSIP
jgi:hypothetical protein